MDWYVSTLRPGATREAKDRPRSPARKDETIVEQSLRDQGYACYLPKMRRENIHHRSKKIITKAYPLFVGYVFVGDPLGRDDWQRLRGCDGVGSLLGVNGRPWPVPEASVEALRVAQSSLIFDDTREARIKRGQEYRTRRETFAMQYPPGAEVAINSGHFAGFHGQVKGVTGRGAVQVMIMLFGRLSVVEMDAGWLQRAA